MAWHVAGRGVLWREGCSKGVFPNQAVKKLEVHDIPGVVKVEDNLIYKATKLEYICPDRCTLVLSFLLVSIKRTTRQSRFGKKSVLPPPSETL